MPARGIVACMGSDRSCGGWGRNCLDRGELGIIIGLIIALGKGLGGIGIGE